MPNYYTQFSFMVSWQGEAKAALLAKLAEVPPDGDYHSCEFEDQGKHGVWIHSDDNCLTDPLVNILAEIQEHYRLSPFGFTWSGSCSKPAPDGFTGGAICLIDGNVTCFTADDWLAQQLEATASAERSTPRTGDVPA